MTDRQTVMTEKSRQFFTEKIRVTPSVAARGDTDTNPSDATAVTVNWAYEIYTHHILSLFKLSLLQLRWTWSSVSPEL